MPCFFIAVSDSIGVLISRWCDPEHAGLVKKVRPLHARKELLPLWQSPRRPPRVNLVRAVAHADNSRFAAGTRSCVPGAISIQQNHIRANASQLVRRPRAKRSGANDGHLKVIPRGAHVEKPSSTSCFTVICDEVGLFTLAIKLSTYFARMSVSSVHRIIHRHGANVRMRLRERNNRNVDDAFVPTRHCQADPVDRDRTLLRHVPPNPPVRAPRASRPPSGVGESQSDSVDVPLD